MVADRNLMPDKLLRRRDRRLWRHHDAAGRDDIGFAPHRADMLRRRSAYRETRTTADGVTVEGRDPDDQTLMLC